MMRAEYGLFLLVSQAIAFSVFAALPAATSTQPVHLEATTPVLKETGGVKSLFTDPLLQTLRNWPTPTVEGAFKVLQENKQTLSITCVHPPGNDLYIGGEQYMWVDAAIEKVSAILDDVGHYEELFPGYADIHIVPKDGPQIIAQGATQALLFWEQHIPIPFVPNIKYEMDYLIDKSSSERVIYRYQLKKPERIKLSDGFILLEKISPTKTRYTEYDFFDADWGAAKMMGKDRIWKDSIEGMFLSDIALKIKAEHPELSYSDIKKKGEKLLKEAPVEAWIKARKTVEFPL